MKRLKQLVVAILLGVVSLSSTAFAAEGAGGKLKPYPLKSCLVSGEKLGANSFVYRYKDREIKFCCKGCLKEFNKNPEKFLKKLDKGR
jgi:YHS domain-containing protein